MARITVSLATRTAEQAGEPILYRVGRDYNVVTNIRRASMNEEGGVIVVEIEGALEEVQRAIAWLNTTGIQVDAEQRSVSDSSNL